MTKNNSLEYLLDHAIQHGSMENFKQCDRNNFLEMEDKYPQEMKRLFKSIKKSLSHLPGKFNVLYIWKSEDGWYKIGCSKLTNYHARINKMRIEFRTRVVDGHVWYVRNGSAMDIEEYVLSFGSPVEDIYTKPINGCSERRWITDDDIVSVINYVNNLDNTVKLDYEASNANQLREGPEVE